MDCVATFEQLLYPDENIQLENRIVIVLGSSIADEVVVLVRFPRCYTLPEKAAS